MKLEELSIAIIAKKEKENIELFLNDLLEYSDDVFVVDSNSYDGTKGSAQNIILDILMIIIWAKEMVKELLPCMLNIKI